MAEREAGAGSGRTRVAAITTSSVEALKAYIEGERAFRTGSYLPAVDAFQRAVAADPEFALAYYRVSMTEERLAWAGASQRSAEAAWRHVQRLPAREPLERALFYDPGDLGALYHLVRIAIKDGDTARMDELAERFVALSPTGGRTLELRALQAAGRADRASFEAVLDEMQGSPGPFLPIAVWSVGVFGQDLPGAEAAARLMVGSDRPPSVRGAGHVQLAYLALAQGRYRDARVELDRAQELGDPDALEARAWLAVLPFIPSHADDLASVRDELEAAFGEPSGESPNPSSFFSAQNGVHDLVNLYMQGLIASRLGDGPGTAGLAADLEARGATEDERGLARQLAIGVRVQEAARVGDPAHALELLAGLQIEGWYELTFVSPYFASALERFTLAELLLQAGRGEEAQGWYQGLRENSTAELVFIGPALLREAAIHRQAGREAQARELSARFVELWGSADPELRSAVMSKYGQ